MLYIPAQTHRARGKVNRGSEKPAVRFIDFHVKGFVGSPDVLFGFSRLDNIEVEGFVVFSDGCPGKETLCLGNQLTHIRSVGSGELNHVLIGSWRSAALSQNLVRHLERKTVFRIAPVRLRWGKHYDAQGILIRNIERRCRADVPAAERFGVPLLLKARLDFVDRVGILVLLCAVLLYFTQRRSRVIPVAVACGIAV